jgi:hypothetical protein
MGLPRAADDGVPESTRLGSVERISRAFTNSSTTKALHRSKMEEPQATPHDHPWSFDTEILDGGYVEEVFHLNPGGGWHSELVHRIVGETYDADAAHIHRIVELPSGECWPLVRAGPHARETRFWRFGNMVQSRAWHERKWTLHV